MAVNGNDLKQSMRRSTPKLIPLLASCLNYMLSSESQPPPHSVPSTAKRGRKRNDTLPPNRARDVQREFRARRAAHLEAMEARLQELEDENAQLRVALNLPPAVRPQLGRGPTGKDKPRQRPMSLVSVSASDGMSSSRSPSHRVDLSIDRNTGLPTSMRASSLSPSTGAPVTGIWVQDQEQPLQMRLPYHSGYPSPTTAQPLRLIGDQVPQQQHWLSRVSGGAPTMGYRSSPPIPPQPTLQKTYYNSYYYPPQASPHRADPPQAQLQSYPVIQCQPIPPQPSQPMMPSTEENSNFLLG